MTRKQAVLQAIEILSKDKNNIQIVEKLQDILNELPLSIWTNKSILDTIENYALEHNNILPQKREMTTKNKLPSSTVICERFDISSIEDFFKQFFPEFKIKKRKINSPYIQRDDYFKNIFITNYEYIKDLKNVKIVNASMYNQYRNKNTPHSSTIIKRCKCKTYDELLILFGYKKSKQNIIKTIDIIYDDTNKRYNELKESLRL